MRTRDPQRLPARDPGSDQEREQTSDRMREHAADAPTAGDTPAMRLLPDDEPRRAVRAVRGATSVAADEPALMRAATRELLSAMLAANALRADDVISAFFTVTGDLASDFPATAAREMGWHDVPLLCAQEIPVAGAPPRIVRVMLHVETPLARAAVRHVYLGAAAALRPDLATPADAAPRLRGAA
jgi:chorismate mutase